MPRLKPLHSLALLVSILAAALLAFGMSRPAHGQEPGSALESAGVAASALGSGSTGAPGVPAVRGTFGTPKLRIEIVVPPGTAGHAPEVALVYENGSAHGSAGWVGFGWNVQGPSAIVRDSGLGVPYDYASSGCGTVGYCYHDRYALDGQHLIDADGSPGTLRFKLQRDNGSQIDFLGDSSGWEIRDRAGRLLRFGTLGADSHIENPRNGEVYAWLLDEVRDAHGNWVRYEYHQPAGAGVAYLARILYGNAEDPTGSREIHFVRETRPDRGLDYGAGFKQELHERLRTIEVRADGALVTRYELAYTQSPASGRSLLASIEQSGSRGEQRLRHRFEYRDPPVGFDSGEVVWSFDQLFDSSRAEDPNQPTSSNPYSAVGSDGSYHNLLRRAEDFNGDGLIDLYASGILFPGTGDRFLPSVQWHPNLAVVSQSNGDSPHLETSTSNKVIKTVADVNGDGYPDEVSRWPGAPEEPFGLRVRLGGPEGFTDEQITWQHGYFSPAAAGELSAYPGTTWIKDGYDTARESALIDMTGDGLPDRVWVGSGNAPQLPSGGPGDFEWWVWRNLGIAADGSQGSFASTPMVWSDPSPAGLDEKFSLDRRTFALSADVNGDGLPDRVFMGSWSWSASWFVAYNYGAGFDVPEPLANSPHEGENWSPDHRSFRMRWGLYPGADHCTKADLFDLNGDGFVDHVAADKSDWPSLHWDVRFGTGAGFQPEPVRVEISELRGSSFGTWGCVTDPGGENDLADYTGDGSPDYVLNDLLTRIYPNQSVHPDLLERATNPYGGSTRFDYVSSARMQDADGLPANPELPFSIPLVARQTRSDGRPETPDVIDEFHYSDASYDREAREFLGFRRVVHTAIGDGPNAETTTYYEGDPATARACAGVVRAREIRSGTWLQQREEHDYQVASGPAGVLASSPEAWSRCLPSESRFESVAFAETTREMRRENRVYSSDGLYDLVRLDEWGRVDPLTGNNFGGDDRRTSWTYAVPQDPNFPRVSRPASVTVATPDDPTPVSSQRFYYDGLPLGQVGAGLLTSVEALHRTPLDPAVDAWLLQRTLGYDRFGNLRELTGAPTEDDPDGLEQSFVYDPDTPGGRVFPVATVLGSDTSLPLLTTVEFSDCPAGQEPPPGLGLPCHVTNPQGEVKSFGYDDLGRVVRHTLPGGLVIGTQVELPDPNDPNALGESVFHSWFESEPGVLLHTRRFVDGLGRGFREESPGRADETIVVERSFDDRGRLLAETIPHFAEAPAPHLERRFGYDALGRPSEIEEYDGETRRLFGYRAWTVYESVYFGEILLANRQRLTVHHFDGLGRKSEVRHDPRDASSAGGFAVRSFYDAADRLTRIEDQIVDNPMLCFEYARQNCISQNHQTLLAYDTLGRRVELQDPDSGTWTFAYDAAGRLTRRTDATGTSVSHAYDALGRLVEKTLSPSGNGARDASFVYGGAPGSGFGRLVAIDAAGSGTDYTFGYDAAGRRVTERQLTAGLAFDTQYVYDALGRVVEKQFPDAERYRWRYDGVRLAGIDKLSGSSFFFGSVLSAVEYDALGRQTRTELVQQLSDEPVAIIHRGYDPATARLSEIRGIRIPIGGGWGRPSPAFELSYSVDGLGRVTELTGSLGDYRINHLTYEPVERSFEYDGLGRLTRATGPWEKPEGNPENLSWAFEYDMFGNPVSQLSTGEYTRNWSYDHPNKPRFLTGFEEAGSTETMLADAAGRPIVRGSQTLTWNAENRLHAISSESGEGARSHYDVFRRRVREEFLQDGTQVVYVGQDFEYDTALQQANKFFFLDGQRIASVSTDYRARSAWEQHWLYRDLLRPLGPVALGAGAVFGVAGLLGLAALGFGVRRPALITVPAVGLLATSVVFTLGPGAAWTLGGSGASPVSWHGSHQADVLAYMTDHLGSTLAVVDWKRSLLETRDYGPFGRVIEHTGDLGLKHQFTGQPSDDTTGLQNYGARMYDARWARFLSPDERVQSFDSQGLNRYSYVSNQPTSMVDPGGEFALGFGGGFGGIGSMGGMSSIGSIGSVNGVGQRAIGQSVWAMVSHGGGFCCIGGAGTRVPGLIYITGHEFAFGLGHLAHEFTPEGGSDAETLSAGYRLGKLKSDPQRPSDKPKNNKTIGKVIPPDGVSPERYWEILKAKDADYCDCLDYSLFPEGVPAGDRGIGGGRGYNSNSYVTGIVDATGGTVSGQGGDPTGPEYPGAQTPIPASSFSPGAP